MAGLTGWQRLFWIGIIFGMFIIVLTIVMAVLFNWYAGKKEAEG